MTGAYTPVTAKTDRVGVIDGSDRENPLRQVLERYGRFQGYFQEVRVLIINRKPGEAILITLGDLTLRLVLVSAARGGGSAKLGFEGSPEFRLAREEVVRKWVADPPLDEAASYMNLARMVRSLLRAGRPAEQVARELSVDLNWVRTLQNS